MRSTSYWRLLGLLVWTTLLSQYFLFSQSITPNTLQARRTGEPIKIDGKLTEALWQVSGERHLIQREPLEGLPASERTDVWIAYDDRALYIATRLFDSHPDSIVGRLARRDEDSESDQFGIGIDAASDKRTAKYFIVNPVGSIRDGSISNDTETDDSWDGIWEVAVQSDEHGWTVEFCIPFSQLRFPPRSEYRWGIELFRRIQRKNEESYLVLHPRNDAMRVSRWFELTGIAGITPPSRIEVLPYATVSGRYIEQPAVDKFNAGRKDPYEMGRIYPVNIGVDGKMGLSGDVTLDLSINPDFAQVEVDPAVVNLTAYEFQYQEKRPFFIEGSGILRFGRGGAVSLQDFNWSDPNFFYSRRIGRAPQGTITHGGFVDVPDRTTILGAGKVSGKITDSWSFAALSAVTDREYGRIDSAGVEFNEEIEPKALYGVVRTLREFNGARQALGFLGTFIERDLQTSSLEKILNDGAVSLGIDGWSFLDEANDWVFTGWAGVSSVSGSKERMLLLQQSPQHYFQRPDANYVEVDSSSTSLQGWSGRVWLDKVRGNWLFNAAIGAISPAFETNDVGFMKNADYINGHLFVGYQWFDVDRVFRYKAITAAAIQEYNFGGENIGRSFRLNFNTQFSNFWRAYCMAAYNVESVDDKRTRGGPLVKSLNSRYGFLTVMSDSRQSLYGSFTLQGTRGESGGWYHLMNLSLYWKPLKTVVLSGGLEFMRNFNVAQYLFAYNDPGAAATYGKRYIFGVLDQKQISSTIRVNCTFTPTLSLQVYLQPLISVGAYQSLRELGQPRTFLFTPYTLYPPDQFNFNYKSLRTNVVLRWEYVPGSTFYVVWTHSKLDYEKSGVFDPVHDVTTLFRDRPDNVIALKLTYWLGQ
ncbi:MAG: DUF5916 domain-containing protein [bacterium]